MSDQCKIDCKGRFYTPQSRNSKKTLEHKAPNDPVHLDTDQSEVNTKQSTQWSNDAVCSFTPKLSDAAQRWVVLMRGAVHTSEQQRSVEPPIRVHVFIDGSQTLSTLGVNMQKKQTNKQTKQITGFHASGSQNTEDLNWKHKWLWGITVLVHHRIILHQCHLKKIKKR